MSRVAGRSNVGARAAALALITAMGMGLFASVAHADTTVWGRARVPELARRRDLVAQAEQLELKYRRLTASRVTRRDAAVLGRVHLQQALALLEEAGAPTSRDARLRLRLASIQQAMEDTRKAARTLESIVGIGEPRAQIKGDVPPPVLAEAWAELAICYARLGRHEEETRAYAAALALEPHPTARSTLLANRAEAFMVMGDIIAAVSGYRASLALLSSPAEMARFAPTTLWGLAVALDRSGDLESGLDAIRLARTYDPQDDRINGPGWFYVPPYDKYWYSALGHWMAARRTDLAAVRMEAYGRAINALEQYIERATQDDHWIAIAHARLKQLKRERDQAKKRASAKPPKGDPSDVFQPR